MLRFYCGPAPKQTIASRRPVPPDQIKGRRAGVANGIAPVKKKKVWARNPTLDRSFTGPLPRARACAAACVGYAQSPSRGSVVAPANEKRHNTARLFPRLCSLGFLTARNTPLEAGQSSPVATPRRILVIVYPLVRRMPAGHSGVWGRAPLLGPAPIKRRRVPHNFSSPNPFSPI